jgi:hypothetical protein
VVLLFEKCVDNKLWGSWREIQKEGREFGEVERGEYTTCEHWRSSSELVACDILIHFLELF